MSQPTGAIFAGTTNVAGDKLIELVAGTMVGGQSQKTKVALADAPQTIDDYWSFNKAISMPNANYMDLPNIDLVGLGDSITYGYGSTTGTLSWLDYIATKGFKSYNKLAVSGASVTELAARPKLSTQVAAIPAGTDFISVLCGINDYLDNTPIGNINEVMAKPFASLVYNATFVEAYRKNLETIRINFPNAQILCITPLRVASASATGAFDLKYYSDAVIAVANYLNIPVFNGYEYSGIWADSALIPDGIHPNDAGYMMLAKNIFRAFVNPISEACENKTWQVTTSKLDVEALTSTVARFASNYFADNKKLDIVTDNNGVILKAQDWDSATARPLILNPSGGGIVTGLPATTTGDYDIVVRSRGTGMLEKFDLVIVDATSTPYTKATINAAYPGAKKNQIVVCDNAGATYIKKDDSSGGNWSTFPTVQLT